MPLEKSFKVLAYDDESMEAKDHRCEVSLDPRDMVGRIYVGGGALDIVTHQIYVGAFGKFVAWSFISVTDLQTLSCLVSF